MSAENLEERKQFAPQMLTFIQPLPDTEKQVGNTGQKSLNPEKQITSQLWLQHKNHHVKKLKFPSLTTLH